MPEGASRRSLSARTGQYRQNSIRFNLYQEFWSSDSCFWPHRAASCQIFFQILNALLEDPWNWDQRPRTEKQKEQWSCHIEINPAHTKQTPQASSRQNLNLNSLCGLCCNFFSFHIPYPIIPRSPLSLNIFPKINWNYWHVQKLQSRRGWPNAFLWWYYGGSRSFSFSNKSSIENIPQSFQSYREIFQWAVFMRHFSSSGVSPTSKNSLSVGLRVN